MNKALNAVLEAPPLKRIHPGGQDAMASVAELAARSSNAPQSAAHFEPQPEAPPAFSFSFSLDPSAGTLDVTSPHTLHTEISKVGGQVKATFHF